MSNSTVAKFWQDAGFRVFPIEPETKEPRFKGYQAGTDDVAAHWSRFPNDRVGLLCERIVAIDIDTKDGRDGRQWLEANRARLPATYEVTTPSGGTHLIYWIPTGAAIPNDTAGKSLGPGVDVKANGRDGVSPGYVVAAGQQGYAGNGAQVAQLPDWLRVALCRAPEVNTPVLPTHYTPPERHAAELERHCRTIRDLAVGEQQGGFTATAFKVGSLVRDGLNWDVAVTELVTAGLAMVNEPGRETWQERDLVAMAERKLAEGRECPVARVDVAAMGEAPDISHLPGVRMEAPVVAPGTQGIVTRDYIRQFTNETSAAHLFLAEHPGQFLYSAADDTWYIWDGMKWAVDSKGARALSAINGWLSGIAMEDPTCAMTQRTQWKALQSVALAKNVRTVLGGMAQVATSSAAFDTHADLINTPAGVVDLRTGRVGPHDPALLLSRITAYAPARVPTPIWDRVLAHSCRGDVAFMRYLRKVLGYGLLGTSRFEQFYFFYGDGGTGKGLILNSALGAMGYDRDSGYAVAANASVFTENRTPSHEEEVAELAHSRAVFVQEIPINSTWNANRIKSLTGGDAISARGMYESRFTYLPRMTLLLASNYKPRFRDVDESIRRRLRVMPFTNKVSAVDRDETLKEQIRAEFPGIVQWLIDGAVEVLRDGLREIPAVVDQATREYTDEQDTILSWIEERCEEDPEGRITMTTAYEDYCRHFEQSAEKGERPLVQREFSNAVAKRYEKRRLATGVYFMGVKMKLPKFGGNVVGMPGIPRPSGRGRC